MCIPAAARGQPWVVISREEQKRAENEATFRAANERIRAAERELEPPLEPVPYLCECDEVQCHEPMRLTAPEYEHIRENGAAFGVLRGRSSNGEVVEEHEHHVVVRKPDGSGGEVARALDPRGEDA